ncbi:hypothetical protein SISNIDRAFT_263606 [Sistotremastrum niveocremeum HHB9708]|uniref:Uncharacterized protein n=1 Tax=Sistotremastrum niveocremeum HHB9708 TaxID=1314777 RepID=A0A164P4J2_9AGAM|nr:hypothetical protein SISNIDRAFT_263606 [Sistotremastrum niveocremeum HHB9708]
MLSKFSRTVISLLLLATYSSAAASNTVCSGSQMGIGTETEEYDGTFATIWTSGCTQADFTSNNVANICGKYTWGSTVSCSGSKPTSVKTSLDGNTWQTYSSCVPAPAGSNCNAAFGMSLNTTIAWCCS